MFDIEKIDFDKGNSLVPAIVQDYKTKEVLMLAYMNKESLNKTLESGTTWFYSRSRNEYWNKGATSGNLQFVKEMYYDCDGDTILVMVEPKGPACHTGKNSCFFNKIDGGRI
ncbi:MULTISPECIES: phosphoribosyl-AMP cyclohydrolase [Clostridium]|uniref:Phosphoribosyl-AMP cyclohydrolase n=1 Tax=Clostridium paridis TaxID=2803863 RepID=A0A937FE87_9CLOT|nr:MULTISPECIES: phosphoribosyl-AMP cyclohydrolase [Clostridium]MBL4932405.1 phosphoribosyl-AMP cyclohydrolase [Clostridium paridis]